MHNFAPNSPPLEVPRASLQGHYPKTFPFPAILMKPLILLFLTLFSIVSCDLIEYHPYDTHFSGSRGINARNIERIQRACNLKKQLRFVLISDTQRWYDETRAAVRAINSIENVDFVIHAGDLTDFGVTKEFVWMRNELEQLNIPYVCLLGNHDCLGTGEDVFCAMYGNPDFTFNAGFAHFLCLNTNAFEYDYSTAVPDFNFIAADRASLPAGTTRTIVAMHAQPTSEQFNNNVSELFQEKIKQYPGLTFCMCGHGHSTQVNDLFGDGVLYYECGSAKKRQFILFTLNEGGEYNYEIHNY